MEFSIRSKKVDPAWYLLAVVVAVYLFFAWQHLTKFETADEHYWVADSVIGRIQKYWGAVGHGLKTGNWDGTYVNDKPGISLAYVSGIGMLFDADPMAKFAEKGKAYRIYRPDESEKMFLRYRLPQVIFTALMGVYFFWAIRKITGKNLMALLSVLLILWSPIILGISQIVNPDSLLWIFSFATLLAFNLFLKTGSAKQALLAAWWLGWAFLSKYAALIFVPFLFVMSVAYYFYGLAPAERDHRRVARIFGAYPFIVGLALLIFMVFLPATFRHPDYIFGTTIRFDQLGSMVLALALVDGLLLIDALRFKSRNLFRLIDLVRPLHWLATGLIFGLIGLILVMAIANWANDSNFLNLPPLEFDSGRSPEFQKLALWQQIFLQVKPLAFSLTPVVLLGLIAFWGRAMFRFEQRDFLPWVMTWFLVPFYLAVTNEDLLVNIRYSIIVYPMLSLIAAFGIYEIGSLEKRSLAVKTAILAAVAGFSLLSLNSIRPWYFNYTNDLLTKDKLITGAWGYGGYEAAQYLNSLPKAEENLIWTDYRGVCTFYKGPCIDGSNILGWKRDPAISGKPIEYFVRTRRGKILNKKEWIKLEGQLYVDVYDEPVWRLIIGGRGGNYVTIYPHARRTDSAGI